MKLRMLLVALAAGLGVALAVTIGNRMSPEAMAVVIGLICGVTASIPLSLLVGALGDPGPREDATRRPAQPPAVVVLGPGAQVHPLAPEAPPRHYHAG